MIKPLEMVSNCRKETVTRLSSVFLAPFFPYSSCCCQGFRLHLGVCVISCALSGTFVLVCAEVLGACKLIKCVNMSAKKKGSTLMMTMVLISVHAPE